MDKTTTKIFVTKYALTVGVYSIDADCEKNGDMAIIRGDKSGGYFDMYLHKGDFHLDEVSALQKAEEMRIKKLKALDKQMKKVSAIKFEVKHG